MKKAAAIELNNHTCVEKIIVVGPAARDRQESGGGAFVLDNGRESSN
jgi:hypothetical protein